MTRLPRAKGSEIVRALSKMPALWSTELAAAMSSSNIRMAEQLLCLCTPAKPSVRACCAPFSAMPNSPSMNLSSCSSQADTLF